MSIHPMELDSNFGAFFTYPTISDITFNLSNEKNYLLLIDIYYVTF